MPRHLAQACSCFATAVFVLFSAPSALADDAASACLSRMSNGDPGPTPRNLIFTVQDKKQVTAVVCIVANRTKLSYMRVHIAAFEDITGRLAGGNSTPVGSPNRLRGGTGDPLTMISTELNFAVDPEKRLMKTALVSIEWTCDKSEPPCANGDGGVQTDPYLVDVNFIPPQAASRHRRRVNPRN